MINFAVHQARAGLAGASEDFEQMLGLLVRATCGEANLVFANPGDWGIDVVVGDLRGRVTVWQAKYFVRGVARGQQRQIEGSFASARKAAADHGYTLERWVLCIPASMDGPVLQWWQGWQSGQQLDSGAIIELWDETRLREVLLRPEAGHVRRHYYNPYRLDGQLGTRVAVTFPYRGLGAFREQDTGLFFGREDAAGRVLDLMSARLSGGGMLVVSGVSGAGKSSLLRAGVLPRLREAGLAAAPEAASWPCLMFTPANSPVEELAVRIAPVAGVDAAALQQRLAADPAGFALTARQAALAALEAAQPPDTGQRRVLLVVDQCEQLFTVCQSQQERHAFITALHAASSSDGTDRVPGALVVLVVRADFEARLADYPELATAVQDRYLLTAMTRRQLRMAITQPAAAAGSRVEDDLVQVLLDETGDRAAGEIPAAGTAGAGALPLLSHALDQAWRTRAGRTLTLADYERTGGIEGAVAASAQRAYQALTAAQQNAARQVFLRLTAAGSDGSDTTAPANRADLTAGKSSAEARDVEVVLDRFAAERLLTLDAASVEISHEALLTAWPLLRDDWLADARTDRVVRTRLHATATEWTQDSRDPSYLYSGSLLETAAATAARIAADPVRHPPLSQAEHEFLRASDLATRRRARGRQSIIAFLAILAVGLGSATIWAMHASQEAASRRDVAISGQLMDHSELLGDSNPVISRLESIAAWRISPSSQASYAMLNAATLPGLAVLTSNSGPVHAVAFSPDGNVLVTGNDNGTAQLWDVSTRQPIGSPLNDGTSPVDSVAFSPDGKTLATGTDDGTVRLWDVSTRRQIGSSFNEGTRAVNSIAFAPDGETLAVGTGNGNDNDGTVQLRNVATHRLIGRLVLGSNAGTVYSVAFSPDGNILATGSGDGMARLWDVATRRRIGSPLSDGADDPVDSVAFSPDGRTLAIGTWGGTAQLWNVATRQQTASLSDGTEAIYSVAFSPDGKTLATGTGTGNGSSTGTGGAVQLWDVTTGQQIGGPLSDDSGTVASVAFSPDGKTLATGSWDGTARLWNVGVAPYSLIENPPGQQGTNRIYSVAFSPACKALATGASTDSGVTVQLWDTAAHRPISPPLSSSISPLSPVALSPACKFLAVGGGSLTRPDGTVQLWDGITHRQIGILSSSTGPVDSLAFSPDGKTLAVGTIDTTGTSGAVLLWEVATHRQIGILSSTDPVDSLAFSPDGKTLAVGTANTTGTSGAVQLWDMATHRRVGPPLKSSTGPLGPVAFSPDGKTVATGIGDGGVLLWNVATHRQSGSPISGQAGTVYSIAFSPDGETLAIGTGSSGSNEGDTGTVQLWDVATQQQIGSPHTEDTGPVDSVAFSTDGKTLATGTEGNIPYAGTVQLWNVAYLVNPVPYLCASAGQSMTRAEWTLYIPDVPYQNLCP